MAEAYFSPCDTGLTGLWIPRLRKLQAPTCQDTGTQKPHPTRRLLLSPFPAFGPPLGGGGGPLPSQSSERGRKASATFGGSEPQAQKAQKGELRFWYLANRVARKPASSRQLGSRPSASRTVAGMMHYNLGSLNPKPFSIPKNAVLWPKAEN